MSMKVYISKVICTYLGRNVSYGCRDNHDELSLVYQAINIPLYHLYKNTFQFLVLLCLECIMHLI